MRSINQFGHRVVVTGIGVLSPLGNTINDTWSGLIAGNCGISHITKFDTTTYPCKIAGELKNFQPTDWMEAKAAKRQDPFTIYAVAASRMAFEDAQLGNLPNYDRVGVIIGSGIGGIRTIGDQSRIFYEKGHRYVSPFMIPSLIANMAAGVVSIELGLKGPNFSPLSACATGTHSIGEAFNWIKLGKADVLLAGGSEAAVQPLSMAGFCSLRALSTSYNDHPESASRPFDATRDGFVMGEGAGVLVLESFEHALTRGANIYCEIIGYSATSDAHHITAPCADGDGLWRCYRELFAETGVSPQAIDYINAHGTSTPMNDRCETAAIKNFFGEHARQLAISSTKGATGHLLGATGALEAAVCVKAIETGVVPPTINYQTPDPDCDLDYTPNVAVKRDIRYAISENMGFGGQNAALMFKHFSTSSQEQASL